MGEQTRLRAAGASRSSDPDPGSAAAVGAAHGGGAPDQDSDPSAGKPKKPLLAAAAIVGAILVAMPLLILATDDSEKQKDTTASAGDSGTLLDEIILEESPVTYAPAEPEAEREQAKKVRKPVVSDSAQPDGSEASTDTDVPRKKSTKVVLASPSAAKASPKPKKATGVKTFLVTSGDTGKCLSTGAGKQGSRLVVWDCDGSQKQRWQFANDASLRINGLCLDLPNSTRSTEAKIRLWDCNGGSNQKFELNGNGELMSKHSGHCLDVWHGRTNGTYVTTWLCNGQPNQVWSRR